VEVSSDLQEISHNDDCLSLRTPGQQPEFLSHQSEVYKCSNTGCFENYLQEQYSAADVTNYRRNYPTSERVKAFSGFMDRFERELERAFNSDKEFTVIGGHSIWYKELFKQFSDKADPVCQSIAQHKMANTAVVSAELVQNGGKYRLQACKYVYLGAASQYTFE